MIGVGEIVSSIRGAFRLATLNKDGLALFNRTPDGFWRSFVAAAIVAPGYLLIALIAPEPGATASMSIHDVLVNGLAYVIGWVAFPVAMAPVSRLLEREDRYVGYIVAYNWAGVPQMLLLFISEAMMRGLDLGDVASGLVGIATVIAILVYYWFIARAALDIDAFAAVGVVAIDIVLTLIISAIASAFSAAPAGISPT